MKKTLGKDSDYEILLLLMQARDVAYRAREKEVNKYGIKGVEGFALFVIKSIGSGATPAEVARWMFRQHNTVTALLDRMEKKQLIRKDTNKNRSTISLTEKGEEAFRQSSKREAMHFMFSVLSQEELQQFKSYLMQIRDQGLKYLSNEPKITFP